MRKLGRLVCCMMLIAMGVACSDKETVYPSVALEFLTVSSDHSGAIVSAITDKGEQIAIIEDRTQSRMRPDSTARIVANIATVTTDEAAIYALATTISPLPLTTDSPEFEKGLKTDPVEVMSIWKGHNYLNMVLAVKTYQATHTFHFVEWEIAEDVEGGKLVKILLYHDADTDRGNAYNTKRAYASVPLMKYLEDSNQPVSVSFYYYDEANALQHVGPYLFQ